MPRLATATTLALVFLLVAPAAALRSQHTAEQIPEVLVLGTYHMANPGRDLFNTEADDVLSAQRQAEIEELIDVLARFEPTKVAVEADFNNAPVGERYAAYVSGEYVLSRNEIDQLGYRLARRLGHETVHPVDAGGEFPWPRLVKFVQATGREAELEAHMEDSGESVAAFNEMLTSHTILEALLTMNSDERSAAGVGGYFRLAEFGEPWDWAGADLVADWFRRNMRIYTNIVQLVDAPDERILVIYGAGHLGWLRYAFDSNPRFRLRKLDELVD